MSSKDIDEKEHVIEKLKVRFYQRRTFKLNILAFLIGIVGALSAYGFKSLVDLIREFSVVFDHFISGLISPTSLIIFSNSVKELNKGIIVEPAYSGASGSAHALSIFILLIVAAAITGPIIKKFAPEAKGHGVPEVIEAVEMRQGIIKLRVPVVKAGVSAVSIGAGMSLGSEGPIVQITGGIASYAAQKFKLRPSDTKLLVVCGISAGISAIFTAPIGGILFGIEAILMSISITTIIPLIFSSLIAAVLGQILLGSEPIFSLLDLRVDELLPFEIIKSEMWIYLVIGIVAGLGGIIYQAVLYFAEDRVFEKLKIPFTIKLIIGSILVGVIGIWFPEVLGTGYNEIRALLNYDTLEDFNYSDNPFHKVFLNSSPLQIIILGSLVLFIVKLLATSLSIGSGASGGIFAPGLFLGASLGAVVGGILHTLLPIQTPIGMCALFGMAGVFGGSARIPFTMIIMTAELTGEYFVFLPLMITVFISYWINESVNKYSIYTKKLANRGITLQKEELEEYLENFPIVDIMAKDVIALSEDITIAEGIEAAQIYRFHGFPIIDKNGVLKGTVTLDDMYKAQLRGETNNLITKDMSCSPELFITPFESVKTAMDIMFTNGIGRLPVVKNVKDREVVGIITERDVVNVVESQNIGLLQERMKRQMSLPENQLDIDDLILSKSQIAKKKIKRLHSTIVSLEGSAQRRKPNLENQNSKIQTFQRRITTYYNKITRKFREKMKKTKKEE